MLKISKFTVEGLREGCVTDEKQPKFAYTVECFGQDVTISGATLTVGDWKAENVEPTGIRYAGPALKPYTCYEAVLKVKVSTGEEAEGRLCFETGRMGDAWKAMWISDPAYKFTEKKVSPVPMSFRKTLALKGEVKEAKLYATALGVYELTLDGEKVGDRYFAPGFTSYKSQLMYQTYDVTKQVKDGSVLMAHVAGGWAVGSFVFTRGNRFDGDRQAFLAELHVTYADGSTECIGTDESWDVTEDGCYRMADLYDGETYDATIEWDKIAWRKAAKEKLRIHPTILADYGSPVKAHELMVPASKDERADGSTIYDFGQNFAGVICLKINGKKGQVVTVKHAEILNPDGSLNLSFLRTAKATATYTCKDGEQVYSPRLSYMGFRYVQVSGVKPEDVEVSAFALYSDVERIGDFSCSNDLINRLQKNIIWGAKSNFVDIPTDCPQRDERMGWTGDIAVFSPVACYNFDMERFLGKWLKDVRSEQLKTGGIPNTVPVQSYGFPATMPRMAVDWWGDACVLVPWNEYQAYGDVEVLRQNFPMMKKYVKACKFWAGLFSTGKKKYIWDTPATLHFGDWIAPDVPQMSQWQGRAKWTATASLKNTSYLVSRIAEILGETEDAKTYRELSENVADAYVSVFTDGNGKLLNEFQTGYVLPIYLNIFSEDVKKKAAANLAELVKKNDYCIGTGFPGTPYILFALADNGQEETAFKMLMNTKCPSWLYEVRVGATTIWERWDGLDENGMCPIGNDGTDTMISYNHYASGAVGDFLYRRIAGIEATSPAYKTFKIKPLVGGGLSRAKGELETPYGTIISDWKKEDSRMVIDIQVPVGTTCELTLPGQEPKTYGSGRYHVTCAL
ncbi:MAG: family 78 glycoside hydrolase catalytic domain [Lachnospiraceae bacterium]|nr:family 78 glycoside hydrolase catalytic domain [Lachnospiraceae bacterium]